MSLNVALQEECCVQRGDCPGIVQQHSRGYGVKCREDSAMVQTSHVSCEVASCALTQCRRHRAFVSVTVSQSMVVGRTIRSIDLEL